MNQEKPREYKQCIYSGPALERTEEILRFRQPLSFEKTRSLKFPTKNFQSEILNFQNSRDEHPEQVFNPNKKVNGLEIANL